MPDIHHRIPVAARGIAVIDLAASAAGFAQWWAEDAVTEAESAVSLGFFGRATVYRLRLLARSPRLALVLTWRTPEGGGG